MMISLVPKNFLALHWRERIEVRVVAVQLPLTLTLSQWERE